MNTLPDLSQLTHEQLLEFTRQLAMQHQSLAQSNQELEKSNQQLDAKVQHLSILNQKYEHELHCLNSTNLAVKTNISPQNKSICGMKRSKKILPLLIWNWNG
jgi:uncharacterized protein (DUF3084 family)